MIRCFRQPGPERRDALISTLPRRRLKGAEMVVRQSFSRVAIVCVLSWSNTDDD